MELSIMVGHYRTLLGLTFLLITSPAWAYPTPVDFDGKLLRWNISVDSGPILYEITADDSGDVVFFRTAIDDAVALWNNVPTSYFRYQEVSAGEVPQVTLKLQSATSDQFSAGYAIFDEADENGPIHCSIIVSTTGTYESVGKTILHELGHCFGLGHSLIPEAIMSYKLEENSFDIDIDDEAAITRLYPADGSSPALPPGCSIGPKRSGFSWIWFLILPGLLTLWELKRASRRHRT